jgi:hypothetical protein
MKNLIEYPSKIIGKLESEQANLSSVYYYFGKMYNLFEGNQKMRSLIFERLKFIWDDVIGLSYILTPFYAAQGFFFEGDKQKIFQSFLPFYRKFNLNDDNEAYDQFVQFINDMSSQTTEQMEFLKSINAQTWWNFIGKEKYPILYCVAKRLMDMIPTSATSERVWSIFKFIHSRLRNKLTDEKIEKLVQLYVNSALLDEDDDNDYILGEEGALIDESDFAE